MSPAVRAAADALAAVVTKLQGRDRVTAEDLVWKARKYGNASDAQLNYMRALTERGAGTEKPATKTVETIGDFAGVVALFARAKESKLQYPKITLAIGGQPVQLAPAGERSKYAGQIHVTDGRPYGQNKWFGAVTADGAWTQGFRATEQELAAVRRLLQEMSQNPAATAKRHGVLTGRCCFCNTALTDERSTAAGFGPVCAKRWGLEAEWKKAVAVLAEEVAA